MLALPSAAAPAPRRQLFVGTALACVAAGSLIGAMLALWMRSALDALDVPDGRWVPKGIKVPMVPANTMLLAFVPIGVFAQWAVYAARRDARSQTALALALVAMIGIADHQRPGVHLRPHEDADQRARRRRRSTRCSMRSPARSCCCSIFGIGFSVVTAFRYLGGRTTDREIVSAHALYWYFLGALFFALWFVVYVTK